jgi:predicted nucleic acid-binding protein
MIFVDSNVLLDVVTRDPVWAAWSKRELEAAALRDGLAINPVVYAELSAGFVTIEQVEEVLGPAGIPIVEMTRPALFLAGRVFQEYRRRGGIRTGVLPDFFIGAQAAVLGATLITRDASRYRSYFPTLALVAPEKT